MIPSGFVHTGARLLIGAGVLVDPEVFHYELDYLNKYKVKERTFADYRCAIIEEEHKEQDKGSGNGKRIHVNSNQVEYLRPHKEKKYHEQHGHHRGFLRLNVPYFLSQIDDDRDASNNVDYGEEHHACCCYFFEIQFHLKKFGRKCNEFAGFGRAFSNNCIRFCGPEFKSHEKERIFA